MKKKCPLCKKEKSLNEFYKNRARKFGVNWCCKECSRKLRRKNYQEHRIRENKRVAEWQKKNKEKMKAYQKKYKRKNPGSVMYSPLKYHNKRVKDFIPKEDFLEWYKHQEKKCYYCDLPAKYIKLGAMGKVGKKWFSIDRKDNNKGYTKDNIVLSCVRCNCSKSNFFTSEEFREIAQKYIKPKWQKKLKYVKS